MSAIRPAAQVSSRPVVPGQAFVEVTASANDPSMHVTAAEGMVRVKGIASNNGIIASRLVLTVDGTKLEIPLSTGMTPAQVQDAVAKALPKPYSVWPVPTFMATKDSAQFRIVKPLVAPPQKNDPQAIADAFAKARKVPSIGGEKVAITELRHALNVAKKDGFTSEEKAEFARQYAGLFDGARYHATEAAQKEYAKLQAKFELPVFPVR